MAFGKLKDTWFIWVLFIVAAVFVVMAFSKSKPQEVAAPDQGVFAEKNQPGTSIKPDHSKQDMKEIAQQKPVSAVVAPLQEVTPRDGFAVQVYSFKEKARAEAALMALKEKNYKAYIMVSDLGPRGIWYRVRVGALANEEEAQKILESVTKDFKSGIIVSE